MSRLDRVGVVASTVCAVHCAAAALLVGASSLVGVLRDERAELGFIAVALVVAASALVPGYCRHRARAPFAFLVAGIGLLAGAHLPQWPVPVIETILSIAGALTLVAAHVFNLRACRRLAVCCG